MVQTQRVIRNRLSDHQHRHQRSIGGEQAAAASRRYLVYISLYRNCSEWRLNDISQPSISHLRVPRKILAWKKGQADNSIHSIATSIALLYLDENEYPNSRMREGPAPSPGRRINCEIE